MLFPFPYTSIFRTQTYFLIAVFQCNGNFYLLHIFLNEGERMNAVSVSLHRPLSSKSLRHFTAFPVTRTDTLFAYNFLFLSNHNPSLCNLQNKIFRKPTTDLHACESRNFISYSFKDWQDMTGNWIADFHWPPPHSFCPPNYWITP